MAAAPKVGFVSLGCPKALVDSEGILTRLRAEGYAISPSYDGADLVVVNTCGFIESAVRESLDAIGEALEQNGRVIVTGCLGAKGDIVRQTHPKVLAVTGPHALEEVMTAVHEHLPKLHDPFADLVTADEIRSARAAMRSCGRIFTRCATSSSRRCCRSRSCSSSSATAPRWASCRCITGCPTRTPRARRRSRRCSRGCS